jgi:hypothetical protein
MGGLVNYEIDGDEQIDGETQGDRKAHSFFAKLEQNLQDGESPEAAGCRNMMFFCSAYLQFPSVGMRGGELAKLLENLNTDELLVCAQIPAENVEGPWKEMVADYLTAIEPVVDERVRLERIRQSQERVRELGVPAPGQALVEAAALASIEVKPKPALSSLENWPDAIEVRPRPGIDTLALGPDAIG